VKMSIEDARVVFEADEAVMLVGGEDDSQAVKHGLIVGMSGFGGIGRGAQAAFEALVIEFLAHGERARMEFGWRKEGRNDGADVLVTNFLIVGAEIEEKLFVIAQERSTVDAALVPDQNAPAVRFQNASKFMAGGGQSEPMGGLRGGDEVDAGVGKRGGFGGAGNADKVRIVGKQLIAGLAHLSIGLDSVDTIAVFEQDAGEESGAGSDVSDSMLGSEAACGLQEFEDGGWVAGAVASVVVDAGRETLGSSFHGKQTSVTGGWGNPEKGTIESFRHERRCAWGRGL
jgi:hypothetical protein